MKYPAPFVDERCVNIIICTTKSKGFIENENIDGEEEQARHVDKYERSLIIDIRHGALLV